MAQSNRNARVIDALNLTARHASQVSVQFLRGMASRMATSFEKYGDVRDAYPDKVDAIACARMRIASYLDTGNTEYLMDAANFIMIEFMLPRHKDAHFAAEDSAASPGRVGTDGTVGQFANTSSHENIRQGGTKGSTAGGFYKREGD